MSITLVQTFSKQRECIIFKQRVLLENCVWFEKVTLEYHTKARGT